MMEETGAGKPPIGLLMFAVQMETGFCSPGRGVIAGIPE